MAYQRLGKMPIKDVLAALQARNPALYREIEPYVTPDGSVKITSKGRGLAKVIDDWLEDDHYKQLNAALIKSVGERGKQEADQQAALARLEQYARERRLSRVQSNVDTISAWLDANAKGYWSVAGIDAAVRVLSAHGRLKFEPPPCVPKPAPQPKPWVEGDPLPDNATEAQLRTSFTDEIKAWLRRQR